MFKPYHNQREFLLTTEMAVGWCSFIQKYGALAFIVLQTSLLVVVMHVSRTAKGDMYAPSTAVVTMEFIKMGSSLAFVLIFDNNWSIVNTVQSLHREIISQPQELINSSVPSFLYVIQNNLLYYALSHLDPATYQVVYNLKILTTAVFSMTILSKPISQLQWLSLVILTIGVALAQYSGQARSSHGFQNTWLGKCSAQIIFTPNENIAYIVIYSQVLQQLSRLLSSVVLRV